jgi:superfamily I DNA/RNA helicase
MILPNISVEQNNIIIALKNNNNVVVDSVAGSGKTTCNLHIATIFNNLNILLLTYNSKLKIETREKVNKLKLGNLEVHTYHSFCVKYYDNECFNDTSITKLLKTNKIIKKKCNYDLIILDEAQDITPTYFELICKIYRDNDNTAKICLLGDRNQSIYDFNKADERFIVYAERIFNFNTNFWSECKLTESFRITDKMSDFINNCMFNYSRIRSNKKSDFKPRYIVCETFGNINISVPFEEVKYYLNLGYKPDEIFILAPSIKNSQGPIRKLENKIKTELNIPIYVPLSDDEKIDADILTNKMVFSTFHQTKGLERKVVIIFNFDDSYFKLFKKDQNPKKCPNELYVATTRAIERLTILHNYTSNFLPFINIKYLTKYTDFIVKTKIKIKEIKEKIIDTSVTDLIKHLPQDVINECMNYLTIDIINEKSTQIEIDTKTKQENGYENVSEITGTAIPAYFEYKLNNKMSIYNEVPKDDIIVNDELFIDSDEEDYTKVIKKIDINKINLDIIKEDELLYIANRWSSYKSGFIFKTYQITNYDWLTNEQLNLCINRL